VTDNQESKDVRIIRGAAAWMGGHRGLVLLAAVVLVIAFILIAGLYTVKNNQTAAVRWFGKLVRDDLQPGIHFTLPGPIEGVSIEDTSGIRRLNLVAAYNDPMEFLTGDENIIGMEAVVQYRVSGLGEYLFGCEKWESLINFAATAALTENLATMNVDEVLTTGKAAIQLAARERAQELLEGYNAGITVVAVTLRSVTPPPEAADAFRRVSDAKAEREKLINVAQGKRSVDLSLAQGEAAKIVRRAQGAANERTNAAKGEAERFLSLLGEYQKAKRITETDLYLKAMSRLLPRVRKVVLDLNKSQDFELNLFDSIDTGK